MKTKHIKITNRIARKLPSILAAVVSILLGLSELAQAQVTEFWDGPNLFPGMVEGGDGVWNSNDLGNANWCDINGNNNTQWVSGADAVFETIGGTVTIDSSLGNAIFIGNLQFMADGYQIVAATGTGSMLQVSLSSTITTDPNVTATISAPLADVESPAEIDKAGLGTLILSGTNTYSGDTFVNEGILNIQNDSALGAPTNVTTGLGGTTVSSGATLQLQGNISVGAEDLTISGAGAAGQNGALVNVSGTNNYGGLLGLSDDSTISSDSGTLNLTNPGTITGGRVPFALTLTGAGDGSISSIIGTGISTLTKSGTGTWTLNGVNTYTGLTTVTAGTLAEGVSNAISTGDLTINGATAIFDLGANHSDSVGIVTLDGGGSITGTGTSSLTSTGSFEMKSGMVSAILNGSVALNKTTTGTVTLTGANTYTGSTTVNGGTLLVDGSLDSAVTVNSGGTFGGTGVAGAVAIVDGGILAPGDTVGTLTVGSLSLSNASLLNYELGTPGVIGSGVNDLITISGDGDFTLDGILNTTALTGFGPGGYRLFDLGGTLTDNTLDIGTVPSGFVASNFIIVTGVPNEVDLLVLTGPSAPAVQFWDGSEVEGNGKIDGGMGNWDNFATNWTDAAGATNSSWQNGEAVFAGTAGTVTVTQPIFFTGLEFMTGGYQIDLGAEGSLSLLGSPIITTDTGITTITAILDGAGGIIKDGPGTLVLSGANTYLGSTTINAGILSISSDGNLGTAPSETPVADQLTFDGGTLQATASFTLDANRGITLLAGGGTIGVTGANVLSYGGVITGSGSLTKTDTGTLTLLGANTYTGATTVNSGTLMAGAANTLPAQSALNVVTGATFDLNNFAQSIGSLTGGGGVTLGTATLTTGNDNTSTDFSGIIGGTGGLSKVGTGTQTLSGANTYTGATTVNSGTLMAGAANTLPAQSALNVVTGATFDLNNFAQSIGSLTGGGGVTLGTATLTTGNDNTSTDFSGIIGGTGGLSKVGTGTQILSGANTYTGATTVNSGTLMAGAANTLPAQSALNVVTGATFDLNNFAQSIGSLAGGGGVTLGTATLTTGNNNTSTDFSGIIDGAGGLSKVGTGTQTLSGANTYTGATTVNGGSLFVDGSVASMQTLVNSGGVLGGLGFIGGNLDNSGIVSPGHSPGTLTVGINYTQTSGGTLRMEVGGLGASDHDLLMVNGTATLAGTLQIIRLNNFQFRIGDQLTLLIANGGVTGTFNPIENDFFVLGTFAQTQIDYFSNSVVLEQVQGSFADFASAFCFSPNHIAVGAALDSAVGDPRAAELIDFLNSDSFDALCRDLDLISPDELVSVFNINVSLAGVQTANLERRMDDIRGGSSGFSAAGFGIKGSHSGWSGGFAGPTGPEGKGGESVFQPTPDNPWGVFITGLGEFTNVDGSSNAPGYDLSTGGLTFGVDYRIGSHLAIGLTGGYAHTDAEVADNGRIDVDGGKVGLYATAFSGGFYVDAAVNGGFGDYDTRRTGLLGDARGGTDGGDVTAFLGTGYDWKKGSLSIGPIAHFQYTYVNISEFTESGSLAPLTFNDQSAEAISTAIGFKTSYEWKIGNVLLKPELRASWQHEFGDTDYSLVSHFASGAGSSFTVHGPTIGRDSLLIGAGAALQWNDRIAAYAYYDGELGRTSYTSHNISAGIRVNF